VPGVALTGGSLGGAIQESEPGPSSVGCAHVPERAVDFAVVALEPASGEAVLAESEAVDLGGEDTGVVLAPGAEELGDVVFAREGLDPDSEVAVEALWGAAPDEGTVLPLAAEGFDDGPITGGMPNPAGETGLPGAEADDEPVPGVAGEDAEEALPRGDVAVAAGDAPGRGVDTCDAAPDDVGADVPLPAAESVSTGPSGSNN
jgi:hypothetical protein